MLDESEPQQFNASVSLFLAHSEQIDSLDESEPKHVNATAFLFLSHSKQMGKMWLKLAGKCVTRKVSVAER